MYLSLRGSAIGSNDLITAQTDSLLLPLAGAFTGEPAPGLTLTPLLRSSEKSELVDAFSAQMGADAIRRHFKSGMKPLNLAVRLTGKFKTAFPDGKPREADPAATNETAAASAGEPGLKESQKESMVVLVADVDMLYDAFWARGMNLFGTTVYEPFNDNMNFFANALEQLAGSSDFVNIRCRGRVSRPFTRVLALERQAQEQWMMQENALQEKLESTQQHLSELQVQKQEIETFKQEIQKTQRELKGVRKNLREGIENLGAVLKALNIILVPAIVCMAGIGLWLYRRSRTRQ